jgi:hypothetical protein
VEKVSIEKIIWENTPDLTLLEDWKPVSCFLTLKEISLKKIFFCFYSIYRTQPTTSRSATKHESIFTKPGTRGNSTSAASSANSKPSTAKQQLLKALQNLIFLDLFNELVPQLIIFTFDKVGREKKSCKDKKSFLPSQSHPKKS